MKGVLEAFGGNGVNVFGDSFKGIDIDDDGDFFLSVIVGDSSGQALHVFKELIDRLILFGDGAGDDFDPVAFFDLRHW